MEKSGYTLTRLDISPSNGLDLDERFALEHFSGKNQEDAAALLEQNFEYYVEDLPYMGDKAFSYYLGSVKLYLEKNEEKFFPSDYVSIAQNLALRQISRVLAQGGSPTLKSCGRMDLQ